MLEFVKLNIINATSPALLNGKYISPYFRNQNSWDYSAHMHLKQIAKYSPFLIAGDVAAIIDSSMETEYLFLTITTSMTLLLGYFDLSKDYLILES